MGSGYAVTMLELYMMMIGIVRQELNTEGCTSRDICYHWGLQYAMNMTNGGREITYKITKEEI